MKQLTHTSFFYCCFVVACSRFDSKGQSHWWRPDRTDRPGELDWIFVMASAKDQKLKIYAQTQNRSSVKATKIQKQQHQQQQTQIDSSKTGNMWAVELNLWQKSAENAPQNEANDFFRRCNIMQHRWLHQFSAQITQ